MFAWMALISNACGKSTRQHEFSTMIQKVEKMLMLKSEISFYDLCSVTTSTYSDWSFMTGLGGRFLTCRQWKIHFP